MRGVWGGGEAARLPAKALLLDGGGFGGGVAVEFKEGLGEAPAPPEPFPHRQSYTTIPGPSSIEEERRSIPPRIEQSANTAVRARRDRLFEPPECLANSRPEGPNNSNETGTRQV
jgi:hypothetical protein